MLDPEIVPTEYVPGWLQITLSALFGAGGVKTLATWLENKRLANADFRETLLERIKDLEESNLKLHEQLTAQATQIGTLTSENRSYRAHFELQRGNDEHP